MKEGKQVGIIYHFTSMSGLKGILEKQGLRSSNDYISFTRNFNMPEGQDLASPLRDLMVRLAFDGDKLSNKYKIEPFLDRENKITREVGEAEERIKWPPMTPLPILKYLLKIDFKGTVNPPMEVLDLGVKVERVQKWTPLKLKENKVNREQVLSTLEQIVNKVVVDVEQLGLAQGLESGSNSLTDFQTKAFKYVRNQLNDILGD